MRIVVRIFVAAFLTHFVMACAESKSPDTDDGSLRLMISAIKLDLTPADLSGLLCAGGESQVKRKRELVDLISLARGQSGEDGSMYVVVNGRGHQLTISDTPENTVNDCVPGLAELSDVCKSLTRTVCEGGQVEGIAISGGRNTSISSVSYHKPTDKFSLTIENTSLVDSRLNEYGQTDIILQLSPDLAERISRSTEEFEGSWAMLLLGEEIVSTAKITGQLGGEEFHIGLERKEDADAIATALSE